MQYLQESIAMGYNEEHLDSMLFLDNYVQE